MKLRHHFSSHHRANEYYYRAVRLSSLYTELLLTALMCVLFACIKCIRLLLQPKKVTFPQNTPALAAWGWRFTHPHTHTNKQTLFAISFRLTPTLFYNSLALLLKNFVVGIYYRAKIFQSPSNFYYSRCSASDFQPEFYSLANVAVGKLSPRKMLTRIVAFSFAYGCTSFLPFSTLLAQKLSLTFIFFSFLWSAHSRKSSFPFGKLHQIFFLPPQHSLNHFPARPFLPWTRGKSPSSGTVSTEKENPFLFSTLSPAPFSSWPLLLGCYRGFRRHYNHNY